MKSILRAMFRHPSSKQRKAARRAPLHLEALEDRRVMSVTYHGGALLSNVEVQGLYYGSDWSTNSTLNAQTNDLDGYLQNIVNSSYMDMLANEGYSVGRGTFSPGKISLDNVDKTSNLNDSTLRSVLQSKIDSGVVEAPDANRLYVIFVEPGVAVQAGPQTSINDFLGYHWAFGGHDASGNAADIHYAVIAYPGGAVNNASLSWLSAFQQLTQVTSHEISEAVTDPDYGYNTLGWYDDDAANGLGEIGDLANARTVYLNGYAVQRMSDMNDQAMTPAGASALTTETFVLQSGGNLYVHSDAGFKGLASSIASISDQAIDNFGQAMIDVVTTDGKAYEYHEGSGWVSLGNGVVSAKAGQGVSYVLTTDGSLSEYNDATQGWTSVGVGIAQIDAGTDKTGVNMVDVIQTSGDAWEYSDSTGWHFLASGVQSISAGQQGITSYLQTTGAAYEFFEWSGASISLGTNVTQVATGTGTNGISVVDYVFASGDCYEVRSDGTYGLIGNGVSSVTKARNGLVSLVFSNGDAYDHDASGNLVYLAGNVTQTA